MGTNSTMGEIKQRKNKNKPNEQKNEKKVSKKGKSSPVALYIVAIICAAFGTFYMTRSSSDPIIAKSSQKDVKLFTPIKCSTEYQTKTKINNCSPTKCGRMVIDNVLTNQEILILKHLAQSATQSQGGG